MQNQSSQPKVLSTLHTHTLPYTTSSQEVVYLTSLTYLQITKLQTTYGDLQNTFKYKVIELSTNDTDKIPYNDFEDIFNFIMEMSVPEPKVFEGINTGLMVIQDEKYSTDDFRSCIVCQEKGLDKLRNCPLLGKEKYRKGVVYTFKDHSDVVLKECPMYEVNQSSHLSEAINLMSMLEHGSLPVSGGMLEQTVFVVETAKIVKPLIDKKRQPIF